MIDAPWYQDPVETLAFNLYAMNVQELEDIASEFANQARRGVNINDINIQRQICRIYGVNFDNLADNDIDYLQKAIMRKMK